jgi:hypothetical protein
MLFGFNFLQSRLSPALLFFSVITRRARPRRHCEERSEEAIQGRDVGLDCFATLAMTAGDIADRLLPCVGPHPP